MILVIKGLDYRSWFRTMASVESLRKLCECPICEEPFKDPRILNCDHQFCAECIRRLGKHEIKCPTCYDVTKPRNGDLTTLPRSALHQHMQDLILNSKDSESPAHTRHNHGNVPLCNTYYDANESIKQGQNTSILTSLEPMMDVVSYLGNFAKSRSSLIHCILLLYIFHIAL